MDERRQPTISSSRPGRRRRPRVRRVPRAPQPRDAGDRRDREPTVRSAPSPSCASRAARHSASPTIRAPSPPTADRAGAGREARIAAAFCATITRRSRSSAPRMPRRTRRCATSTNGSVSGRAPSRRWRRSTCRSPSPATLQPSCHATGPSALRSWARPSSAPPPPGSPRLAPVPSSAGSSWGSSCWLSLVLITVSFRSSALDGVQGTGATVLRPFEVAADRVARPFADTVGWFRGLVDAKNENKKLRAQNEALRRQLILDEGAIQQNVELQKALNYHGPPSDRRLRQGAHRRCRKPAGCDRREPRHRRRLVRRRSRGQRRRRTDRRA